MINKKLLYLTSVEFIESNGIARKIQEQILAMERIGILVDLIHRKKDIIFFNEEKINFNGFGVLERILFFIRLLNFTALTKQNSYDVIYVRNPDWVLPIAFSWFMRSLKKSNPNAKFILELPTFPCDEEAKSNYAKLSRLIHRFERKYFFRIFGLIVYMGNFVESIWGVKSLQIKNCVDVASLKIVTGKVRSDNCIIFIGVARLSYWHGYDRLIESISHYNLGTNIRRIKFLIVGDGKKEIARLKTLAKIKSLDSNDIEFLGPLSGTELDKAFDLADIGVDSLGRHRSNIFVNSSLKSKEYIARGLPLIKSHSDSELDDQSFVYNIAPNEDLIDISKITAWYDSIVTDRFLIRSFARDNFLWDIEICKIFNAVYANVPLQNPGIDASVKGIERR